jgi:two-component system response regulator QseB
MAITTARSGDQPATETEAGSSILIVEDEPGIADPLERGLRTHGHSTAVTDEPSRALSLALSGGFDLIVLDLGLPGGDGFDVLRAVRERGRRIPIIILTGQVEERDAAACIEAGADVYMTKPFRFDELMVRVTALLEHARPGGS